MLTHLIFRYESEYKLVNNVCIYVRMHGILKEIKGWFKEATQDRFERNLKALKAWQEDRIHIVKGFFKDSIPSVASQIKSISFLRLDGDLYSSTKDALDLLYFKINPNGLILVDDYGTKPTLLFCFHCYSTTTTTAISTTDITTTNTTSTGTTTNISTSTIAAAASAAFNNSTTTSPITTTTTTITATTTTTNETTLTTTTTTFTSSTITSSTTTTATTTTSTTKTTTTAATTHQAK